MAMEISKEVEVLTRPNSSLVIMSLTTLSCRSLRGDRIGMAYSGTMAIQTILKFTRGPLQLLQRLITRKKSPFRQVKLR